LLGCHRSWSWHSLATLHSFYALKTFCYSVLFFGLLDGIHQALTQRSRTSTLYQTVLGHPVTGFFWQFVSRTLPSINDAVHNLRRAWALFGCRLW
jgi:hypothetical protein